MCKTILPHTFMICFSVVVFCFLLSLGSTLFTHAPKILKPWLWLYILFHHRLALCNVRDCPPTRPCSIMREDPTWGLDGWVLELPLPNTSWMTLRSFVSLGFNFLIFKRKQIRDKLFFFFSKGSDSRCFRTWRPHDLFCIPSALLVLHKASHGQ